MSDVTQEQIERLALGVGGLAFTGRQSVELVVDGDNLGDPLAVAQALARQIVDPDDKSDAKPKGKPKK
jgi:hypothetical protein